MPAMRLLAEDQLEARAVGILTAAAGRARDLEAERTLADTQRAFDGVASRYDRSNAANQILCAMRKQSRDTLDRLLEPGSRVLDLGCGPGTDDVPLAESGHSVTAIDWSPRMIEAARLRLREAGLEGRVRVEHLGIHQLDALAPELFDAAYSSFGALNCVPDLAEAARAIRNRLRPRGLIVASVIGRVCPWELCLYASRGAWSRARLRFSRQQVAVPLEGRTVWTRYYKPGEFARAFASAGFRMVSVRALGLVAPPPYLEAFAERHPALVARLHRVDEIVGGWPLLRSWGDHFLIAMRKGSR